MKSLSEYIVEAKNTSTNTPLNGIVVKGKEVARLSASIEVNNGFNNFSMNDVKNHCSKGIFVFKTKKDVDSFVNTTASSDFWKEIYGYEEYNEECDYNAVNKLMKIYGNVIEGKTLYIYTPTKDVDVTADVINDLKARCDKASETFNFASYQFLA